MKLVEKVATIGLEAAAVVANANAGEPDDHSIRDPRGNLARDDLVLAPHTISGDEIVAFLELRNEERDVTRVILQIAIHGHDDVAARTVEPRLHGLRLAVVARELEEHDARIGGSDRSCNLGGGVPASIIHKHELPRAVVDERIANGIDEWANALLLVVEWNDDREVGDGEKRHAR